MISKRQISSCPNTGCSTVVHHMPRDQEVMGLKPTSYFLVSFYFLLRQWSVLIISTAVELTACDRERSWVQILPSAGLFSSFLTASLISYLTEVQHC